MDPVLSSLATKMKAGQFCRAATGRGMQLDKSDLHIHGPEMFFCVRSFHGRAEMK